MGGTLGKGSQFSLGGTTVCEITNLGLPSIDSDDIDVTTHCTSDNIRDFVKGLINAGEIVCDGNFDYTEYATVYDAQFTQSLYSCSISLPTTPSETKFEFSGYVKSLSGASPHDDKINSSFTTKITTKPVLSQV